MTKKQERLMRAAEARKLLGLDAEPNTTAPATAGAAPAAATERKSTPDPVPLSHYPKKHPEGSLKKGTPVFYRGTRWYVEHCPSVWSAGTHVRITNQPFRMDEHGNIDYDKFVTKTRESFCVHADHLTLALPVRAATELKGRGPTQHAVEERQRQKAAGVRDVGDPVAVKLRDAKTLDDVYRIGSEALGVPEADLRAKYGRLNPGQQRMNVGNRMRAKFRKEGKI